MQYNMWHNTLHYNYVCYIICNIIYNKTYYILSNYILYCLSTMDLFWFRILVQWDVSTTTVVSCPSHLLGGLLACFPYWSLALVRTTMLGSNGTGAWTSTTAVWTRSLPRSMSFVPKTGIIDLQTERWGKGGVSGTYWVWTGWRFHTLACARPTTALCVSVQGPNCKALIHLTSFDVGRKSNLWSKLLRRSCWIPTGASRTAA